MAYCSKCGSSLNEGDKVCGNCGEPVPGANRSSSNSNEIWMGILSYLGILALIPYFVKDQTPFVRAHAVRGINLLLLGLGCIMDMAPLILITTPILFPVVVKTLGMDPVQFGIMMMLNLGIGLCTPPVGSALFVGCAVGKIPIEEATRAMIPFYVTMIVVLLLITFVPQIVMFIPNLVMPQ